MGYSDFHVHTTFSDGNNTPEENIIAAIEKNMENIGFSDHSYTDFDKSWCMKQYDTERYRKCILALKEKYSDRIKVYCGIEQDFYSKDPPSGFDYVIGSVHYILADGRYLPIDENVQQFKDAADRYFDGDIISLAEEYYRTVSEFEKKPEINMIGHFDLVCKFNESDRLFDSGDIRYINSWKSAAEKLIKSGKIFEINTGAVSRRYRTSPYPSYDIIKFITDKGGRFILSSDAHRAENLCFEFDKWLSLYGSIADLTKLLL